MRSRPLEHGLLGALLLAQVVVAGYLFALGAAGTIALAVVLGLPAAALGARWFARADNSRYRRMCVVMFAAGGFGMLSGLALDFGPQGVGSLLALCQAPLPFEPIAALERHVSIMPWTYVGMLAGGNLALLIFDSLGLCRTAPNGHQAYHYLLCNAGMVVGMVVVERLVIGPLGALDPLPGSALLIVAMLAGMTAGMAALAPLLDGGPAAAATRRR